MREIKYLEAQTRAENSKLLSLSYFILVDDRYGPEHYGVKITEKHSKSYAVVFDLTTSVERIYGLMEKLTRNTVTPAGLMDVVADWL